MDHGSLLTLILSGDAFFRFFGVGDHRGIILDIPQYNLLGGDVHKIFRSNAQHLNCNNSHVTKKYNNILELYCIKHRIQHKNYSLFPPAYPVTAQTNQAMDAIDLVINEGMAYTEKKCRKIHAGEVPFSDKLVKAGCQIKVWRLVIRHKETNRVNTRTTQRAAKKCNLTRVLGVSLVTAHHRLARAWKKYKQIKKSAHCLRNEFLCDQKD